MAQRAGISGRAVALATAGGVLVYAGLRGESPLEALRSVLTGSPAPLPEGKTVTLPAGSSIGATGEAEGTGVGPFPGLASAAEKYLGVPYKWAGTSRAGLDCSGLVVVSFRDNGITGVPRTSLGQMSWSKVKRTSEPGRGDLVWWPGHIGIMVSSTRMINAPHTGTVVRYASVGPRNGHAPVYLRYVGNRVNPSTPRLRRGR